SSGNQVDGEIEFAHQRRAGGLAGYLLGRATEIEVDNLRARSARQPHAFLDPAALTADQLNHGERQALANRGAAYNVGPTASEVGAGDHLGGDIRRAEG